VTVSLLPLLLLAAADPAPVFVLHSTRDDEPAGALVRLDATAVQVAGAVAVPVADCVALRRRDLPPPHYPHDRPHAVLANGDRLPGRAVAVTGDQLQFRAELGREQDLTIPLTALSAVWFTPRAAARAAEPDGRRLLAEKRRQDVVLLTNQDALRGTVTGLADGGPLALDPGGPTVSVPRDRIQGLLLNTDLARTFRPRGPYRQLVLRNGGRVSLKAVTLDGADLAGTTLFGATVRVPLAEVAALNTYQGKAVYLSDLAPQKYDHTPYLGVRWPLAADRAVTGLDLRLGGGTFDKGVGLHSRSRATFALPRDARRFEAIVGLDEATGRAGSATVQVLADDRPLLDPSPPVSAGRPVPLRLALPPGARTLTLAVEFGAGGEVQDHVDWADARVVVGG
jgi:NPCBM/NEW2 domain